MKNVKHIVNITRLLKSLAVSIFLLVLFAGSSAFKSFADGDPKKLSSKDSLLLDKNGFKSLFSASYFDPSKPYFSQLNPKAVPFVQQYIRSSGKRLERMKFWGKPYFDMYDGILVQHGLPKELKYLSVIESDLLPNVVSWAGAVGPWQIMAEEATRMGLRINSKVDERTNFYKSTHAAARILKELYKQFHDWTLVVAAYNCGAGRVRQAIRKSGSRNFWDLQPYLPLETRNHVKRFIGTHYIFEGSGGLTTMTASEISNFDQTKEYESLTTLNGVNIGTIEIAGKYKSSIIAKNLNIDLATFTKLNPNFDRFVSTGNSYHLRLPEDKLPLFSKNRHEILEQCIQSFLNY
ncbi:MAG: Membrane-bound lytic murein transglycosylase [Segetibacter sp.]|nr:Membrane-bound lytic murein transglycosylase [Segetibacter sp.]